MSINITDSEYSTINQPNHFSLSFPDKATLYKQYMPFIQNGGLFVRTQDTFSLGDAVALSVQLPDDGDQHNITGRVVWVTPESAQRGLPAGIGVQFALDEAAPLRHKIEGYLVDMLHSQHPTDTL